MYMDWLCEQSIYPEGITHLAYHFDINFLYFCKKLSNRKSVQKVLHDFLVIVKAAPQECVIRTGLP